MQKPTCGAKTRSGNPCANPPVTGSKRCRMHGGNARKGEQHGNYKHGRYSQYLSERMKAKVEAFAEADPFDITDEIALLRATLGNWVETFGDILNAGSVEVTAKLVSEIRQGASALQKLRSDTAITPAEVMVFLSRFIEVAKLYVPAESWGAFVASCQSIFGANVSPMLIDVQRDE